MKTSCLRHILPLIILFPCYFALSGCFTAHASLVNTYTSQISDLNTITLSYSDDNITVFKSDSDELIIKEYISNDDSRYQAAIKQTDDALVVTSGEREGGDTFASYVELYLPLSYRGSLSIDTGSGFVRVQNEYTLSALDISCEGGYIECTGVSADTLTLTTTSGKINVSKGSGSLDCLSTTGSISVASWDGGGIFTNGSGRTELSFENVDENISASSSSGRLSLAVPKSLAFRFKAISRSGMITVPFEEEPHTNWSEDTSTNGTETNTYKVFETSVGIQPKVHIDLETVSGAIRVTYL